MLSHIMRVTTGTARGHKLFAPKGSRTRPALDKVKKAVFDILFDVTGARVLDLFAGTGSMGIEALSRGAAHAVFVEEWSEAAAVIKKNLEKCRFTDKAIVMESKVDVAIKYMSKKNRFTVHGSRFTVFDLVFIDPPYLKNLVNPTIEMLASSPLLAEHAIMIVEHHPKEPIETMQDVALTDSRKYGQTCISFIKKTGTKVPPHPIPPEAGFPSPARGEGD